LEVGVTAAVKDRESDPKTELRSRKYQAPKLSIYGEVASLTAGGTSKAVEDSQSMGKGAVRP
jgi:hypothetical protein